MKFPNKVLKTMYILYVNRKYRIRDTAREIKSRFNLEVSLDYLQKYIRANFPRVDVKIKYNENILRVITTLYRSCKRLETMIQYVNNKYNLNLTKYSIQSMMSKNGIRKEYKDLYSQHWLTVQEQHDVIEQYRNGASTQELADKYGYKDYRSILDILHKYNIPIQVRARHAKYYYSFDLANVDSYFKGYFIGLMITDGYVLPEHNIMGIEMCDKDVIQMIASVLCVNVSEIKHKNVKEQISYRITLYGDKYISQLKRLGVIERKSLVARGPKLTPDEEIFIPAILRGMMDGDGWVSKNRREFFFCSASEALIDWFIQRCVQIGMINMNKKRVSNRHNGLYLVRTSSAQNFYLLKDIIYPFPYGMSRKYNHLLSQDKRRSETIMETSVEWGYTLHFTDDGIVQTTTRLG